MTEFAAGKIDVYLGPTELGAPDDLESVIVEILRGAKISLEIAVHEIDNPKIAQAILDARRRGFDLRDYHGGKARPTSALLSGSANFTAIDTHRNLNHVIVFDSAFKILFAPDHTPSARSSNRCSRVRARSGERYNDESLFVLGLVHDEVEGLVVDSNVCRLPETGRRRSSASSAAAGRTALGRARRGCGIA